MASVKSLTLTIVVAIPLATATTAPPAKAGDAASVLLGIAAGVLVGTTSSAPQPQNPPTASSSCPVINTVIDPIVCGSPALLAWRQRMVDTVTTYLNRLNGPVLDQARLEINQFNAQYSTPCISVPDKPNCLANYFQYVIRTYQVKLAALSVPTPHQPAVTPASYPPPTPPSRDVRIAGEITEATIAQFDASILKDPNIDTVVLDSPGGVVLAGRDLAMRIRHLHLTTVVPADAECASACFMLFAAGERRIASTSAKIGVHSASYHGEEDRDTLAVSTLMARQCGVFGVPNAILGKMIMEPGGGDVTWLSADELRSMQVEVQ